MCKAGQCQTDLFELLPIKMETIVIAGCGDVGNALGQCLLADGHRVIGIRRRIERLAAGIEGFAADLSDLDALAGLPTGIDVLVYTAAADGFSEAAYRRAYVDGMAHLYQTLNRARLRRVLFVSSTSVYGQIDGSWVDENSVTEPIGFSGRILLEAEALAAEFGVESCVVRFGGIYGPGRTGLIDRVRGGAPCANVVRWSNRIHRDDCARVLRHLYRRPTVDDVYVGVDCEPTPQCEVMDWLAERLSLPKPARTEPGPSRRGGNRRLCNRLLLASGYRFLYPTFREGYTQVLANLSQ